MKNVRNVDLEYKGEVPMDFNMLNMAQHEDILRQTCQIMKEKSAQICYRWRSCDTKVREYERIKEEQFKSAEQERFRVEQIMQTERA